MKASAGAALLLLLAFSGVVQAKDADPVAVGRYHLRKANQLAGEDHCHSAIHEYTLAYQKLNDPVVLFNRGECYRRVGQADNAVADYRAFLEAVPAAPNRADIEAKVAALTRPAPPVAATAPARTTLPPATGPRPFAPRAATEPPPRPVVVLPPMELAPPAAEPPPPGAPRVVALAPPVAPSAPASDTENHSGQSTHTWLWIAIGAVVVGGAAGAYLALRTPTTTPPPTDLGNYRF